ncbi:tetratricopeptide repeat-containing glycosyltransferase family protein [Achromobacter sp.]|uniref:tetratricopeptide repeat-containing glycosyltransferase family protein n=1 Tax=Achromobacter sp. TaxID=134375 RepID=UPI002F93F19C
MTAFRENRLEEARALFEQLLAEGSQRAGALEGLAYVAARQADHARAADCFDQAVAAGSASVELLRDAAVANKNADRPAVSLAHFQAALRLAPQQLGYYGEIVALHARLGQMDQAQTLMQHALKLAPASPALHYTHGKLLGQMGKLDEELRAYQRAIALKPDFVDAYVNAGVALRDMRRFDEALRSFKKAISLDPEHAGARNNRAQTNLMLGDFEHGWRDYEWRWRDGAQRHAFSGKPWLGEAGIAGKTLLVHSEQGLGDTLQFVRYLEPLSRTGARVVLRVQPPLLPLLQGLPGAAAVIDSAAPVPQYDRHVPLLSLPLALRQTGVESVAPYLHADPDRAARWDGVLAGLAGGGKRIGLAWSGNPQHPDDENRSTAFASWAGVLATPHTFVSLQRDVRESDREHLRAAAQVYDAGPQFTDFAETAALVSKLDLVITVDSAVAHLAGALGVPVWVLLPRTPDWRWGLDRADSAWYPSATLFRQATRGDWAPVFGELVRRLLSA